MKKIAEDRFPKNLINRPKMGFGIPLSRWVRHDLKELIKKEFSKKRIENEGLFKYKEVTKILNDHFDGKKDNSAKIWSLLIFQMWQERWYKGAA